MGQALRFQDLGLNSCAVSRSHLRYCDWRRQLRWAREKTKSTSLILQLYRFLTSWSRDHSLQIRAETREAASSPRSTLIQNKVYNFPSLAPCGVVSVYTVTVPLFIEQAFEIAGDKL